MAGPCTLDASVFLNAFNPSERGHAQSGQLLRQLESEGTPIVVPTLLLPEVAAAVSRGREDPRLAREFAATLGRLPGLVLVPLDAPLARVAADVAAAHRVRGSDAVYAAVALRFGAILVTLDRQQRERLAGVLTTCAPAEMIEPK